MIKALFFDLDGTLLTDEKKMLPSTYEALTRCKQKGIKIFLATGRSATLDKMLDWTERELSLFDGGIYCNGASTIIDGKTENLFIDPDVVRYCVEQVDQYDNVHMSLHMENNIHAFNFTLPEQNYGPWGITKEEITELDEPNMQAAVKILVFYDYLVDRCDNCLPEALYRDLSNYCKEKATVYLTDHGQSIQLAPWGVSKYQSVEKFRIRLGLGPDEIAVFGDDINDMEMLRYYKNSIAMGNAVEEVKQTAAFTTRSNNADGIHYGLHNILGIL